MSTNKEITEYQKDTSRVIKDTLASLAAGITGIAAAERKDLILSVGHIFQSLRKGQFLSKFLDEWNKYCDSGRIKDDYQNTEQHYCCLQEFLDFLDKDIPDEIRFDVLKKIFLVAASEEITDRDSILPHQLMKVSRSLSTGEIIVLNTSYRLVERQNEFGKITGAHEWLNIIAEESGLTHPALVEIHEHDLEKKYLISGRTHSDRSGITIGQYFRLTTLGYELCKYIENYKEA